MPESYEDSISYAILGEDGNIETYGKYVQKTGEKLKKYINISNFVNEDTDYKLIVLNNYKQINFDVDGNFGNSYDVFIEKKKELQIPVEISDLDKGMNDLIFILVINATENLTEEERMQRAGRDTIYLRCNIFVDNEDIAMYEYDKVDSGSNMIDIKENLNDMVLSFLESRLKINEVLDYYITVDNTTDEEKDYVVLIFEDWEQKKILEYKDYAIVKVPANQSVAIPEQSKFSKKGTHEIMALRIENIFKEYDFYSMDVFSSVIHGAHVY